MILTLGDALYSEPETKVCSDILLSLRHCLQICGHLLSEHILGSIVDVIKHVIRESSRRRGELTKREKLEDFDDEEAELLREETEREENINKMVGLILRSLVETFKSAFLPFFDELSSYLMPTRGEDETSRGCTVAFILMFNGILGQCSEESLRYYKIYLPVLLGSSKDENPYARQCALYGLGLCAKHGVSVFKPFVEEALPSINEVIRHLHAREPENIRAFHEAVSTLGKIYQFHGENIDLSQIIPAWLNYLPLKGYKNAVNEVHDQLCSTVERYDLSRLPLEGYTDTINEVHDQLCLMVEWLDKELLGPGYEHFPKMLSVFAEVLCAGKYLATEETISRVINILRNLHKTIPPATWASAVSLLLPQQEMELESALLHEEDDLLLVEKLKEEEDMKEVDANFSVEKPGRKSIKWR